MESTPSSVCGFGPVRAHVRMNGTSSGHTSFLLDEKDQVPAGWRQTGKIDETAMETDALDARMYLRPPCMLFEYKFV